MSIYVWCLWSVWPIPQVFLFSESYLQTCGRIPWKRNCLYLRRYKWAHAVAHLVEAVRYKPESRGFVTRLEFFIDLILPGRTMVRGSTQSLTEMSTRNTFWGVKATGAWG
jgi:hypothetical protein